MKTLIVFLLALTLHAEDAPKPPTVEDLQKQLTAKDQQIAQLQAELQRSNDQYLGCVVSRQNMQQRPALNPQQQQMMQRPKEERK